MSEAIASKAERLAAYNANIAAAEKDPSLSPETGKPLSKMNAARFGAGFLVFGVLWMSGLGIVSAVLLPMHYKTIPGVNADALVGIVNAFTAVASLVANLMFGNFSDRSRSRFGRRTPWILFGAVLGGVTLFLTGTTHNAVLLTIFYCACMFGLNCMIAPMVAILSDRVPSKIRGTMSAFYGAGSTIGAPIGTMLGALFIENLIPGFAVAGVLMFLGGVVAVIIIPKEQSADFLPKDEGSAKDILSSFRPPTWMKRPKAYNYGRLVQTPENLKAYAKYFVKYIQAYAEHGITVNQLHVQNEVFADQKFPSALWDSEALKVFIRDYLGPAFDEAGLDTDIWLGTLNGPEDMAWTGGGYGMTLNNYNRFVDNILFDDGARKYIKGIAYQWAGQNCIARTHESWPEIELIQSESECGTGDNSWEYAEYIFHLINHYFRNGATAYTYWNMILDDQDSTWGWWQNSLFTITADTHEVRRNPEYYVMRHFSHFVRPGAKVLGTTGHFNSMAIAFRNPDGTVVVVAQNALDEERPFAFADPDAAERGFKVTLAPRSFNTFVLD